MDLKKPDIGGGALLAGFALLCSQLSLNVGAAVAKQLFPLIGVEGVTAYRVGFAALMMMAVFRPWRTPLTWPQACNVAIYGSVIGLMNLLIYRSFSRIPLGIAVAIEVAGPLAVAVLTSRRPRDIVAIALAVAGLYYLLPIHGNVDQLDPVGVAYAAGAAVCWALYIVFGQKAGNDHGPQTVALGTSIAAVVAVPFGVAHAGMALFTPAMLAGGVAVALLSSALPYSLEMMALRRLPQRVFGILVSSGPAIAALAGFIWLGERLTSLQWLAIALVIVASGGAAATAGKRQPL